MDAVTKADRCVCHFYHRDFERCKLLDKHLAVLCRKYGDTRFIRLSAPVSGKAALQHSAVAGCPVPLLHRLLLAPACKASAAARVYCL